MQFLKKIKDFFNQPDQMDLIEKRFYQRLDDMKKYPEKYQHILKKDSGNTKIPPVSLF